MKNQEIRLDIFLMTMVIAMTAIGCETNNDGSTTNIGGQYNNKDPKSITIDNISLSGSNYASIWVFNEISHGIMQNVGIMSGNISSNTLSVDLVVPRPGEPARETGEKWTGSGNYFIAIVPVSNNSYQFNDMMVFTDGGNSPARTVINQRQTTLDFSKFKKWRDIGILPTFADAAAPDFVYPDTYIAAKPNKSFNYGYFYYIPNNVKANTYLLVEPNNTGQVSNDIKMHERAAYDLIQRQSSWADELGVVLLVPAFPRPASNGNMYTHALDRDTLLNKTGPMARIDLQLIAMIDDFRELCQSKGITVAPKVLLDGFSASGSFVNRFTAIHPELVQAVASGGINCMPILPIGAITKNGSVINLIYPIGIYDIGTITGTPFNLTLYKTVPQFIYMGQNDDNDTLPYSDAFGDEEKSIIKIVLGEVMWDRWQPSIDVYTQQGCNVIFKVYQGVGHGWNQSIISDILAFFKSNM